MVKHILSILVLSFLAVLLMQTVDQILQTVFSAYHWFESQLNVIFSGDSIGHVIQTTLALLLLPACTTLLVSAGYWAVKRSRMPQMIWVMWISWAVVLTIVASHGV